MTERSISTTASKENRLAHIGEWMAVQYANHIVASRELPPTEQIVTDLHEKIMSPLFSPELQNVFAGVYRYNDVRIAYAGFEVPSGRDVPKKMKEYGDDIDTRIKHLKKGPREIGNFVEFASYAHYHLVTVHPFVDGNGRTARQFINLLCKRFDVKQFVLGPVHRKAYIDALEKVNMTENLDHLTLFLASNLWNRYSRSRTGSDKDYAEFLNEKIVELSWKIKTAPKSRR